MTAPSLVIERVPRRAEAPSKSICLLDLPSELLICIFEMVYENYPQTSQGLICVNKSFYEKAWPLANQSLKLYFPPLALAEEGEWRTPPNRPKRYIPRKAKLGPHLINSISTHRRRLEYFKAVKVLNIDASSIPHDFSFSVPTIHKSTQQSELQTRWNPLVLFLRSIVHLEQLIFEGTEQIPVLILDALQQYQPDARLHIKDWARLREDKDHEDPAELALASSRNLHSIELILYHCSALYDLRLAAFKRIVSLAPNLQNVSIISQGLEHITRPPHIIAQSDELEREHSKAFQVSVTRKLPLKSLSLWREDVSFLDLVDVSELQTLHLYRPSDISIFSKFLVDDAFQNLRNFTMDCSIYETGDNSGGILTLVCFIESRPHLRILELINPPEALCIPSILGCIGKRLLSLILHRMEKGPCERRKTLDVECVDAIGLLCPNLESIGIDIDRTEWGQHESHTLMALARFPRLRTITLFMNIGHDEKVQQQAFTQYPGWAIKSSVKDYAGRLPWAVTKYDNLCQRADFPNPFSFWNCDWINNIWLQIQQQKKLHHSRPLHTLWVKVGEPYRELGHSRIPRWVDQERATYAEFCARSTERDDQAEGVVIESSVDQSHNA